METCAVSITLCPNFFRQVSKYARYSCPRDSETTEPTHAQIYELNNQPISIKSVDNYQSDRDLNHINWKRITSIMQDGHKQGSKLMQLAGWGTSWRNGFLHIHKSGTYSQSTGCCKQRQLQLQTSWSASQAGWQCAHTWGLKVENNWEGHYSF